MGKILSFPYEKLSDYYKEKLNEIEMDMAYERSYLKNHLEKLEEIYGHMLDNEDEMNGIIEELVTGEYLLKTGSEILKERVKKHKREDKKGYYRRGVV
ncbi:hypothetical protein [Hippea alviniae]|uniref:hypothetical protein n=1 Tax=Hippea alviniae TaxID=1279027 RepID=UPI0003B31193|nr:hypothetical protein [Hippea alviniae]